MKSEQKKKIFETIDIEIQKLHKNIKQLKIDSRPISPENAIGRVSRMDAINNKSITEASLRIAENKLKSLIEIKNQAQTKNFGKCIKCSKQIPIQRILIVPESKKCVNCAN